MDIIETLLTFIIWSNQLAVEVMDLYLENTRTILDAFHFLFNGIFKIILVITIILSLLFMVISLFSLIYKYKKPEFKFIKEKAPTVTIQIPTRNELVAINCAKRCLAFDYPKEKFNIIIGDDSDDPSVSAQLSEFAKEHKQIIVMRRESNIGFKPGNLNNMLKKTTGEIVVIFDSDFLPEADYLKRMVAPFIHDKNLAATQARWNPINGTKNLTTIQGMAITEVFHQIFLPFMSLYSKSACLCGSAEAIRKSKLEKYGIWQSGSLTEDIEYSMRLYKAGERVQYMYDVTCDMEVPNFPKDLYKQQMRWSYGVIKAFREHIMDILRAKIPFTLKCNPFLMISGYLLSVSLLALFTFGLFAFFTHPPGPIDIWYFTQETLTNISFTCGLLVTFLVAMVKSNRISAIPRTIIASFSVGLIVTLYVNKGIYKLFAGQPMQWFLMKKHGEC